MTRAEVRSKLFKSFVKSTFNAQVLIAFSLYVTLIISAFMVVVIKYHYKEFLDKEQNLMYQEEDLRNQWTQILIEHSTLASPSHLEELAKKK